MHILVVMVLVRQVLMKDKVVLNSRQVRLVYRAGLLMDALGVVRLVNFLEKL